MKAGGKREGVAQAPKRRQGSENPRKALVREQLLDKATEIFLAKGYAQTSMNDIAAELGLQRSSVYHYFANKEELLAALLHKEASIPYENIRRVFDVPNLSATMRLKRITAEGIIRRLTSSPRFLVLNRIEAEMPPDLAAIYRRSRRQILDLYTRAIDEGIASGEFRNIDPRVAAFAIIGMANWTSWWFKPDGKYTPEEIGDIIVDFALHGVARDERNGKAPDSLGSAIRALKDNIGLLERLAR